MFRLILCVAALDAVFAAGGKDAPVLKASKRAPFYSCAHRTNCKADAAKVIEDGNNCFEIDLVYWSSESKWYGDHGGLSAVDPTEACDPAAEVFDAIKAADTDNQIVLVWLDFKNFNGEKADVAGESMMKLVREKFPNCNIVYGSLHNAWKVENNAEWIRAHIDPSSESFDYSVHQDDDSWKDAFMKEGECHRPIYDNGWSTMEFDWKARLPPLAWAWERGAGAACHWTDSNADYIDDASAQGGNAFIVGAPLFAYSRADHDEMKSGIVELKKNAKSRGSSYATSKQDWTRADCDTAAFAENKKKTKASNAWSCPVLLSPLMISLLLFAMV